MYDTDVIPQLPGILEQIKAGSGGPIIDQLAVQAIDFIDAAAAAQSAAVDCYDRAAFLHEGDTAREVAKNPDYATLVSFSPLSCAGVSAPAPSGFNDPVHSDIPALVLSGEYDPITPPDQSKHAAETLSHSQFVEFPGMGHGEVFASPECPETIFRAFLADPAAQVDTSCVATMDLPKWAV
jgi:pimeloyl-ACP methyl ester carboxylesterase